MSNKIVFCLVLLCCIEVNAQNIVDNNSRFGLGLELGYSYRKLHEFGGGINYLFYSKTDYKKASIFGASLQGYGLVGNSLGIGARLSLEYVFWTKNGVGFQFDFIGDLNKFINYGLDGRVGLNYGGVYYIFYGYNFYQNTPNDLLMKHSFGLTFRLNWAIFDLENP